MKEKLSLNLPLKMAGLLAEEQGERIYQAVMIREGIYRPGMGNPQGLRIRMRKEVLAAMAPSMNGKKVNLEHAQDIDAEVGYCRAAHMAGEQMDALRGDLVLQAVRSRFTNAVAFIEGRLGANQVPNVSVEITHPSYAEATIEQSQREGWDLDLIGGEFDGCSLVSVGACTDSQGCGVGLCAHNPASLSEAGQEEGETTAMAESPTGKGAPCGGCAEHMTALKTNNEEASIALKAEKAAHEQTRTALKEAQGKLVAFEKKEHEAALVALKQAAGDGVNLEGILGCKPEEAPVAALGIALRAFANTGHKVGLSGSPQGQRFTAPPSTRHAASEGSAAAKLDEMRTTKLGLKAGDSHLPPALRRNNMKRASGPQA